MPKGKGVKSIAYNKKARHDYFIENTIECGIELTGSEVKSLRSGNTNMRDSFARIRNGEVFVVGLHISPYEKGNIQNRDPFRDRKLLLHKREITKLSQAVAVDGYSLVPLSLYFREGWVKLELAVAKGKKLYDKRHSIAEKSVKRDIDRAKRGEII